MTSTPRRRWLRPALAAGAMLLLAAGAYAALVLTDALPSPVRRQPAPAPPPAATRDGRWRQDVAYLASQLPALHRDAFFRASEREFAARAAALAERVPASSDAQIIAGMAELAALIGDGHTAVDLRDPERFRTLPLRAAWIGDALVVTAARPEHRAAIGARVTRIGRAAPEEALAAVTPLIAHDNRQQLLSLSPQLLMSPEILGALGLLPDAGAVRVELRTAAGEPLALDAEPERLDAEGEWLGLSDALGAAPPLRAQGEGRSYWYAYLPETRTLYLHYARCAEDPERPFAEFARELLAVADERGAARLVVDLRFNGGGDSRVFQPLLEGLRERPALRAPGALYALIGRQTFSSALMNAVELKEAGALLLGEPTGGRPNGYGEVRSFRLPNSGLRVQYSTRFFRNLPGSDADALMPDLAYPLSWADLLAGRDPALEAASAGVLPP